MLWTRGLCRFCKPFRSPARPPCRYRGRSQRACSIRRARTRIGESGNWPATDRTLRLSQTFDMVQCPVLRETRIDDQQRCRSHIDPPDGALSSANNRARAISGARASTAVRRRVRSKCPRWLVLSERFSAPSRSSSAAISRLQRRSLPGAVREWYRHRFAGWPVLPERDGSTPVSVGPDLPFGVRRRSAACSLRQWSRHRCSRWALLPDGHSAKALAARAPALRA
jgi:hypothetical protein